MSVMSPSIAFSWSHWNADASQDQIIIRACETLTDKAPNDDDWKTLLSATRSGELKVNEDSDNFSDELAENTQVGLGAYHAVYSWQDRPRARHCLY